MMTPVAPLMQDCYKDAELAEAAYLANPINSTLLAWLSAEFRWIESAYPELLTGDFVADVVFPKPVAGSKTFNLSALWRSYVEALADDRRQRTPACARNVFLAELSQGSAWPPSA